MYHFVADDFLAGISTKQVNTKEELMPFAEEAFRQLTGSPLPKDIFITLCTESELAKAFGEGFTPDVQGFCRNRCGFGTSEVFVKRQELARAMLTLGHEIGHALSPTLPDAKDEEAKAFAFALAWMQAIREHNIGGLTAAILPRPAQNGLHNVALHFVLELASAGSTFMETFINLCKGIVTINKVPEQVFR